MRTSGRRAFLAVAVLVAGARRAPAEEPPPGPAPVPSPAPASAEPGPGGPEAAPPTPPAPVPASPAATAVVRRPDGTVFVDPRGGVLRLRLADAVALGVARNLEIAAGSYDPAIACEGVRAEAGEFDPLLTVGVDGGRRETPTATTFLGTDVLEETLFGAGVTLSKRMPSGGEVSLLLRSDRLLTNSFASSLSSSWTTAVTLEARQPLLRGAGDAAMADLRRARVAQDVANHGFRDVAEDVILRIEEAYWELVFAAEQVVARKKAEEVAAGLEEIASARLDAEVGTPIDVAEAVAGLESRRGDRIAAEGALGAAEDALRSLILPFDPGRPAPVRVVAVDDPRRGVGPLPSVAQDGRFVATALRRRPDLLRALADLARNDVDVAFAADELRPQLDLVARLSGAGLDGTWPGSVEDAAGVEAETATLGLTFSVYLGRRSARARLRIAEYQRRQAGLRAKDLENRVVLEVRAALRDVETARARAASAAEEIRASQETLEGERTRVRQGASTPYAVLEREERVTQAVTREGRAAADLRIALARLHRATGLLADAHRVVPPSCALPR
jgi:outer membrane protein